MAVILHIEPARRKRLTGWHGLITVHPPAVGPRGGVPDGRAGRHRVGYSCRDGGRFPFRGGVERAAEPREPRSICAGWHGRAGRQSMSSGAIYSALRFGCAGENPFLAPHRASIERSDDIIGMGLGLQDYLPPDGLQLAYNRPAER